MKNGLTDDEIKVISDTIEKMEALGFNPRINGTDIILIPQQYSNIFQQRELTLIEREALEDAYKQSLRDKPIRPNRK